MRPADDRRLRCAGDLTSALLLLPVPSVGRRPHRAAGASASKGGQLCCGCSRQLQAFQCTAAQAAPRRSGMDAIIWAWTTALGWPSPHTLPMRHAHAMPCQIAPYRRPLPIHPANPPARQILSIHSTLGAFPVFTCPSALPTLSLHSAASTSLCFSFSFPTPPTTRTPRAPLPFFSLRPCCLRFQKASFRVPFAVVLSPLLLVLACSLLRHCRQHPPRVSTLPILARQVPRRTRIRAVFAACCFRE